MFVVNGRGEIEGKIVGYKHDERKEIESIVDGCFAHSVSLPEKLF